MEILETSIPEDVYSLLVMGVVVVVAIWLVLFVVRKLIGIALLAAIIIGGLMVWHNPVLLRNAQDTAVRYYDQWRYGAAVHEEQRRW
jgi:nicotinamide riboside transporter PnuC